MIPCPTIIKKQEYTPKESLFKSKGAVGAMWTTEEQATMNFRSENRIIISRSDRDPAKDRDRKLGRILRTKFLNPQKNLNIPKQPILRRRLAKTMDPGPEALTWALVSQKWSKKIGSLESRRETNIMNRRNLFWPESDIEEQANLSKKEKEKYMNSTDGAIFRRNMKKVEEILSLSLAKRKMKTTIKMTQLSKNKRKKTLRQEKNLKNKRDRILNR